MDQLNQIKHKIIRQSDLQNRISELRASGKSIGFTNGCFDILHVGHVTYLAQASEHADVLVVGLNSDASVRRQGKGDDRPVNQYGSRAMVLASLGFVGLVVEFDDDTPIKLIEEIKPDVLTKGSDYNPDQSDPSAKDYIVGREVVLENGGSVKAIPLVEGFSTTNIIKKLKS